MRGNIINRIISPSQTSLTEPINATALKDALGVDDPYDSQGCTLSRSGRNARARLEIYLQRSIILKTYIQTTIASAHSDVQLLPYLQSVTSIKGYDERGNETDIDLDDCEILLGDTAIVILPDQYYKTVITFSAGYTDGMPEYDICKEAIIMMVQAMYEHKSDILTPEVKSMVAPLKRHHI